jgi:hypothetical protein
VRETIILRVADGKIAEEWEMADLLGLLQQLVQCRVSSWTPHQPSRSQAVGSADSRQCGSRRLASRLRTPASARSTRASGRHPRLDRKAVAGNDLFPATPGGSVRARPSQPGVSPGRPHRHIPCYIGWSRQTQLTWWLRAMKVAVVRDHCHFRFASLRRSVGCSASPRPGAVRRIRSDLRPCAGTARCDSSQLLTSAARQGSACWSDNPLIILPYAELQRRAMLLRRADSAVFGTGVAAASVPLVVGKKSHLPGRGLDGIQRGCHDRLPSRVIGGEHREVRVDPNIATASRKVAAGLCIWLALLCRTLRRPGAELQAAVAGSQDTPYQVHVTLAERGLASAGCTCPSAESREGACKRGPTNSATRRAADGGERGAQEHTPAW